MVYGDRLEVTGDTGDADFRKSPMKMINRKLSKTTFYLSSVTFVPEDFLRMRVEAKLQSKH